MEYLVENLFADFLIGFALGLAIWFGAFAIGTVFRLVWCIMKN